MEALEEEPEELLGILLMTTLQKGVSAMIRYLDSC